MVSNALGKSSALAHGETVQHYEVDPNYHRQKKNGFAMQEHQQRLGDAPSSQRLLIRAKRLDVMETAKGANIGRAKRLAKLVHDHNTAGRLLIRSKRRDLVAPMTKKQLNRVKQMSFADHHGSHHGYHHESRLGEKHRDNHHEAKRHHDDGKVSLHKKDDRRKESHAKKSTLYLKKKDFHSNEGHGQMRSGKKESHTKKNLHVVHNEEKRREKKHESHKLEKSKKSNVGAGHNKEKKDRKGNIHKVSGSSGHFGKKKMASASHGGVSHSGHEENQRNLQAIHKKWKRNAKKYTIMATKKNYFKKNKKRSLKH